ncbi:MAG: tryptophan--tRNA ligase [Bacteroidales bacterium]|nr:tryptophan--tRNA ligase [Bacteroidales bacterium]
MAKIILTGDRPTGRLHLGHYVGSLRRRVELQDKGGFDKIFIMIADAQALTDNADNPEKVRQNIIQVALDYLSAGLDPAKVNIFIQSMVPQLTELTFYYMNLVTVQRLQRNPTVKQEIKLRGFSESEDGSDNKAGTPVGFFCYPISQAADITAFKATTVPVGEDQEPMIEQCREIVRKFNSVYGDTLVEPEILLPDNAACMRLPGTDGKAKMSKSLGNCIYLSDSEEEVTRKVKGMFTDPGHLQVSDPGKVEGNTVFTYLDAFCKPEHFEKFASCFVGKKVSFSFSSLDEVKAQYRAGGLGDMMLKNFLAAILNETLEPMRKKRAELEQDIPAVWEILRKGSQVAEKEAAATLEDVRKAMRIDYFNDSELTGIK